MKIRSLTITRIQIWRSRSITSRTGEEEAVAEGAGAEEALTARGAGEAETRRGEEADILRGIITTMAEAGREEHGGEAEADRITTEGIITRRKRRRGIRNTIKTTGSPRSRIRKMTIVKIRAGRSRR